MSELHSYGLMRRPLMRSELRGAGEQNCDSLSMNPEICSAKTPVGAMITTDGVHCAGLQFRGDGILMQRFTAGAA
jgi:hypothetical protein